MNTLFNPNINTDIHSRRSRSPEICKSFFEVHFVKNYFNNGCIITNSRNTSSSRFDVIRDLYQYVWNEEEIKDKMREKA